MGIQKDSDTDGPAVTDGGAGHGVPFSPTGVGGNACLTNQDEAEIIEASYENRPLIRTPAYDDDFSTVQGAFRMPGL
jgi:hypothetical protein